MARPYFGPSRQHAGQPIGRAGGSSPNCWSLTTKQNIMTIRIFRKNIVRHFWLEIQFSYLSFSNPGCSTIGSAVRQEFKKNCLKICCILLYFQAGKRENGIIGASVSSTHHCGLLCLPFGIQGLLASKPRQRRSFRAAI